MVMQEIQKGIYKVPAENGYYLFKLESFLATIEKSKYFIAKDLPTEYKVINKYAHGNLQRIDTTVVARICDYCNCKLSDIIEYYPNQN